MDELEEQSIEIKRTALRFSWYMRGGVSYTDVLNMSAKERDILNEIVETNLETTKKTQMPFF